MATTSEDEAKGMHSRLFRSTAVVGALTVATAVGCMLIYPPWYATGEDGESRPRGYHALWSPPAAPWWKTRVPKRTYYKTHYGSVRVDTDRLKLQIPAAMLLGAVLTVGAYFLVKHRVRLGSMSLVILRTLVWGPLGWLRKRIGSVRPSLRPRKDPQIEELSEPEKALLRQLNRYESVAKRERPPSLAQAAAATDKQQKRKGLTMKQTVTAIVVGFIAMFVVWFCRYVVEDRRKAALLFRTPKAIPTERPAQTTWPERPRRKPTPDYDEMHGDEAHHT